MHAVSVVRSNLFRYAVDPRTFKKKIKYISKKKGKRFAQTSNLHSHLKNNKMHAPSSWDKNNCDELAAWEKTISGDSLMFDAVIGLLLLK